MFPFLPQTLISILITVICSIFPCQWLVQLPNLTISAPLTSHTHKAFLPRDMGNRTAGVERWRSLVEVHFGNLGDETVNTVLCLMALESEGDPDAKNPNSTARGLMQILASLWAPELGITYEDLYDPEINLWAARKVYEIQGWRAWSPYNGGYCH
jgi:hypothetical protein